MNRRLINKEDGLYRPMFRCKSLTVVVLVVAVFVPADNTTATDSLTEAHLGSCDSDMILDYEKPLRRLPADRKPAGGPLPFAPPNLSLSSLNFGRTVLQGGRLGYEMTAAAPTSRSGLLRDPIRLHWGVETRLWTVNSDGVPLRVVARKDQRIGTVHHPNRALYLIGRRPGIYRFDMTIRRWSGKILTSYRRYVRILPRRVRTRIVLNRRVFRSGEVAVGRIQNLGTLPTFLVSRPHLRVERFGQGGWASVELEDVPVAGSESVLIGGRAGACKRFFIPVEEGEGSYRFSAEVESSHRGKLKKSMLVTTFNVK